MLSKHRKRFFVVKTERRQIIRKRSESHLIICPDCRAESDFISISRAASIFSITVAGIFNFINESHSHLLTDEHGEIFICLNSFVEAIKKKQVLKIKLIGEKK